MRQWLSENYPGRWVCRGCEASVSWPARSPDFNPLDSFLCANTVDTGAKLWYRLQQFASGSEEYTRNLRTLASSFLTQS
jgi:hypothetical protein